MIVLILTEIFLYEEAKEFIKEFKLNSSREYFKFIKTKNSVVNLPGVPYRVYEDTGWVDWQTFLGYKKEKRGRAKRLYLNFKEAKKWAVINNITNSREWVVNGSRIHKNLPSKPNRTYKDEWKGWADFLGKEQTKP